MKFHFLLILFAFNLQKDLIKMLRPKEIRRARNLFKKFDLNDNGVVTKAEAETVYRGWYSSLSYIFHGQDGWVTLHTLFFVLRKTTYSPKNILLVWWVMLILFCSYFNWFHCSIFPSQFEEWWMTHNTLSWKINKKNLIDYDYR